MDFMMAESRPESCYRAGLECAECSGNTARKLAQISGPLSNGEAAQLFFRIYSDSACSPMRSHFVESYRDAAPEEVEAAAAAA
ncbi:MAG: hypothetical protein K2X35_21100 [Bryobacteraceae bacterium]|nr:hypothetical protein [Bryobacteraceae bacterium]